MRVNRHLELLADGPKELVTRVVIEGKAIGVDRKDDSAVIGISFRDAHITDADLAHMKDFPRLTKLDLTNTSITDAGLRQLKPCKNLQVLILTRTKVSKEGVEELKQELPRLQVVR